MLTVNEQDFSIEAKEFLTFEGMEMNLIIPTKNFLI